MGRSLMDGGGGLETMGRSLIDGGGLETMGRSLIDGGPGNNLCTILSWHDISACFAGCFTFLNESLCANLVLHII